MSTLIPSMALIGVLLRVGYAQQGSPSITSAGIANAIGNLGALPASPGSIVSIYGGNLARSAQAASVDSSGALPTTVVGTQVRIGGRNAPLFYVSPGQVNAQIPFELAPGTHQVTVTTAVGTSSPVGLQISSVSPGIFAGAVVKAADYAPVTDSNPMQSEEVIVIYCTGLGAVTPPAPTGRIAAVSPLSAPVATPTVTIGGRAARVVNAVLSPGFVGLYQVGVVAPEGLANGRLPLVLSVSGTNAPPFSVATAPPGPRVSITWIWSNQIENGPMANFLPGGAGYAENRNEYILI
jgi:uncharacterized protein (TIGR03437 family)